MPFLDDLAWQLEDDGVATRGTDLFLTTRASVPFLASGTAATLHIIETGGTAPQRTHNSLDAPAYLRPSAQVVARANSYEVARAMALDAYISLAAVRNQFIPSGGGSWYLEIAPLQDPFDLGLDERKQCRVAFNVTAIYNRR